VTATPAHDRPYVDGSSHNSVFEQVFLYNGVDRLSSRPAFGLGFLAPPSAEAVAYAQASARTDSLSTSLGYQSRPGWDRLVSPPAAADAGWLLPVALGVAVAAVAMAALSGLARARAGGRRAARAAAPVNAMRAGIVLWGLWLVTFTAVFSASSVLNMYYLAVLAPAVAALCALGLKFAAERFGRVPWRVALAAGLLGAAVWSCADLGWSDRPWRGIAIALGAAALVTGSGAASLAWAGQSRLADGAAGRRARAAVVALMGLTAAVALTGPAMADGWLLVNGGGPFDAPLSPAGTIAQSMSAAVNVGLPHYDGTVFGRTTAADWNELQSEGSLWNDSLLLPGTWIAVYADEGSNYVLGGVRQILPVGGFTGSAPFPTAAQLRRMIARGEIVAAVVPGPGDLRANDPRVRVIVRLCTKVSETGGRTDTAQALLYQCPT
jgi:hypothetical protein